MKLVKVGKIPESEPFIEMECEWCHSVFEVTRADIWMPGPSTLHASIIDPNMQFFAICTVCDEKMFTPMGLTLNQLFLKKEEK